MHPYSIDTNEHRTVPFYLAMLAFLAALFLHVLGIEFPWWAETPSVLGFYGVLYWVFDVHAWRWGWLRKVGLVQTPILEGRWSGPVEAANAPHGARAANVSITQTWTRVKVLLETESSKSHTLAASIMTSAPEGYVLNYQYLNEPKPNAPATMHTHYGTARLVIQPERLAGDYYSGRDRQNYGSISLQRVS